MARPRDKDGSRDEVYRLRLNQAERGALRAAAASHGVTPADFLRAAFLAPSRPAQRSRGNTPPGSFLDPAAVAALNRVGANLNQIARRIHAGDVIQSHELPEVLANVAQQLDRIETLVFSAIEP